jgi:hypothetical protein
MSAGRIRRGFTVIELVTVIFVAGALIIVLLPACASSESDSRRVTCQNRLLQIGLAASNYENAKKLFPVASFRLGDITARWYESSRPANTTRANVTGYSWIVLTLPNLEMKNLYLDILERSKRLTIETGPFDPSIGPKANAAQHASCVPLPEMICPDWVGNAYTHKNTTIDAGRAANPDEPADQGAPEYAAVDSNMPGNGADSFKGKVAPTCYKPIVGTHMVKGMPAENGGMALTGNGLTEGKFADGSSKTCLVAESKECGYASWYDGTLNWLVGNDPNRPAPGTDGKPPWTNAAPALNKGYDPTVATSATYLKKTGSANRPQNDIWWGPSSDHAKGIVYHLFVDGHVMGITDACDPATYLKLITRAGEEPIDDTMIR